MKAEAAVTVKRSSNAAVAVVGVMMKRGGSMDMIMLMAGCMMCIDLVWYVYLQSSQVKSLKVKVGKARGSTYVCS